ncbi:hypothetical protein ACRXCV_00215 (plasmid) [Halobacteriovorax sp. GFR7]|uniref:hypothetical protein n=1 Tax=unclassified Halobacteriovorax TaxID=2639665 RepID=UPI003D962156
MHPPVTLYPESAQFYAQNEQRLLYDGLAAPAVKTPVVNISRSSTEPTYYTHAKETQHNSSFISSGAGVYFEVEVVAIAVGGAVGIGCSIYSNSGDRTDPKIPYGMGVWSNGDEGVNPSGASGGGTLGNWGGVFEVGDRIGVGIVNDDNTVHYFKNGVLIKNLTVSGAALNATAYAMVMLYGEGSEVKADGYAYMPAGFVSMI